VSLGLRQRSISTRLAVAFALVAVSTALIAAVVLSVSWGHQFRSYIQRGMESRAVLMANAIAMEYESAGSWECVDFANVTRYGMADDLEVFVFDADGALVAYSSGRGGRVLPGGTSAEVDETSGQADIVVGGMVVGRAVVSQSTPEGFLTERDEWFQQVSLQGLGIAAVIAVVLASLFGVLFSRGIVRPITEVTRAAEALRRGDRSARTGMSGGDPIADLGATFDEMADAVEAERRFEQQLTADVAHELRTPLQAIQATVEAMQDGVLPVDAVRLALIHDDTVRLGRLTGSILELSSLERGLVPFAIESLDIAVPVRRAIESSRALMESTGHTLDEAIEDGLVVIGDADRLTQAVGNLLSNAARYTPEGGRVRVTVRRAEGDALIEVADSGIGVAEEDRERVFTRFWRADPARSRASGGLGIGLAVVREIGGRHGGTVSAGDTDLGGVAFMVTMPFAESGRAEA